MRFGCVHYRYIPDKFNWASSKLVRYSPITLLKSSKVNSVFPSKPGWENIVSVRSWTWSDSTSALTSSINELEKATKKMMMKLWHLAILVRGSCWKERNLLILKSITNARFYKQWRLIGIELCWSVLYFSVLHLHI